MGTRNQIKTDKTFVATKNKKANIRAQSEHIKTPAKRTRERLSPLQSSVGDKLTEDSSESILDHTHVPIAYLDCNFNFIKVNKAYASADEREPSDFPGKNHFDLYPNAENERIFRQVVRSGIPQFASAKPFEYAFNPERGISHWDWSLVPTKNARGEVTGLVLSLVNVTDRIKALEELSKFRRAVEQSPASVVITDASGKIEYVNQKFVDLTGYTFEEALGKTPAILKSGMHPTEFYAELWSSIERGRDWRGEFCNLKKNGERYWESALIAPLKDQDGRITHFIGIKEDITTQKLAEQELRRSRDQLERLVKLRTKELNKKVRELKGSERTLREAELRYRTVADFTFDWEYWEAPDGTFNYVSPAAEGLTGYRVQDFVDNPGLVDDLILPEDRDVWREHYDGRSKKHGEKSVEFRIRTHGGEVLWIEHACRPVLDQKSNFLGTRASNRDITQRKKAEADVLAQRSELSHLLRAATIGDLTAALAHQLNQPLSAILSNAQAGLRFLQTDSPDLEEIKEIMAEIASETNRASEVIKGIRNLLKRKDIEMSSVDINEAALEVISLLSSEAVIRNIKVVEDFESRIPPVVGDKIQLQQVILNLMVNGFEAMATQQSGDRRLVITTRSHDTSTVQVDVRDCGLGIPEDRMDKIFAPFYSTKSSGMGMGLSISRKIVQTHKGTIWGRNNPDGGATFSFTLPLHREDSK